MIAGIYSEITRATAWTTVPGRRVDFTINANNQYEKETYIDENGDTVFALNYTYNAAGKITSIICTEN